MDDIRMNITGVVQNTWKNFLENGPAGVPAAKLAGDFHGVNTILEGNKSAMFAPTCASRYVDIHNWADVDMTGSDAHTRNRDQNFPCTCGDMHSSDTPEFMRLMGFAPGSPQWEAGKIHELIETLCPFVSVLVRF